MRDFSSKGSTTEAFLLVVTVGAVQSGDVAVHTCDLWLCIRVTCICIHVMRLCTQVTCIGEKKNNMEKRTM
jgi:hypothetical protein